MKRSRRRPYKRDLPSGRKAWQAPVVDDQGKVRYVGGSHESKKDALDAQDRYYATTQPISEVTLGEYVERFLDPYPVDHSTGNFYKEKLTKAKGVSVNGKPLGKYRFSELRRRHVKELVPALAKDHNKGGIKTIFRALSAMASSAMEDEVIEFNPFLRPGQILKRYDVEPSRETRLFDIESCKALAMASSEPALILTYSLCGLRLTEAFARKFSDIDREEGLLKVDSHSREGVIYPGLKNGMVRYVPLPSIILGLIDARPRRLGQELLFSSPRGKVWRESNFYRRVWRSAQQAYAAEHMGAKRIDGRWTTVGGGVRQLVSAEEIKNYMSEHNLDIRPHEMRHAWVTHLRAEGIDPADLAAMAGHTVETATKVYTHAMNRSYDKVKEALA